jgi:hypothetical protein
MSSKEVNQLSKYTTLFWGSGMVLQVEQQLSHLNQVWIFFGKNSCGQKS